MTSFFLYTITAMGSGVGFVAQSLIAGFWSRTFGDEILHFSLDGAVYFLNVGLGALLAARAKTASANRLLRLALSLAILAGISIPLLKFGVVHLDPFMGLPLALVSALGLLAGQLLPLAVRLRSSVSAMTARRLLLANGAGVIACTAVFIFFCLGRLGFARTAAWLGTMGGLTAIAGLAVSIAGSRRAVVACALLMVLPWVSQAVAWPGVGRADNDDTVHVEQSALQKITLTEKRGAIPAFPNLPQHELFLGTALQFSSQTEQAHYSCLVNVPRALAERSAHPVRHALVLGGGDGLAARNLLASPKIETITVVEPDAAVLRLGREEKRLRLYNLDSLRHAKVESIVADPFRWIGQTKKRFDLIVIELPIAANVGLARYFSAEFYELAHRALQPTGMLAVHAGPSEGSAPAVIARRLREAGKVPFVYTTARAEESFVLSHADSRFDFKRSFSSLGMIPSRREPTISLCTFDPAKGEPTEKNPLFSIGKAPPAALLPD